MNNRLLYGPGLSSLEHVKGGSVRTIWKYNSIEAGRSGDVYVFVGSVGLYSWTPLSGVLPPECYYYLVVHQSWHSRCQQRNINKQLYPYIYTSQCVVVRRGDTWTWWWAFWSFPIDLFIFGETLNPCCDTLWVSEWWDMLIPFLMDTHQLNRNGVALFRIINPRSTINRFFLFQYVRFGCDDIHDHLGSVTQEYNWRVPLKNIMFGVGE